MLRRYEGLVGARVRGVAVGLAVTALLVTPIVTSGVASAVNVKPSSAPLAARSAKATLACGSVTFNYSSDTPVTYQQIHATGVSCALAKSVIVRGGKHDAKAPAGWVFIAGKYLDGGAGNCGFTWKHGAERVTGWIVNAGGGC